MKTQNTKNQFVSIKKANIVVNEDSIYEVVKYIGIYVYDGRNFHKINDIDINNDIITLFDLNGYKYVTSFTTLKYINLYIKK